MAEKYLHAVSCRGDLDAVKHCLEHAHPAVDGARTRGRTALWEAAARGHAAVCAALLDAGASADAEDWSGASPLVVAARRGRHRAAVRWGHACEVRGDGERGGEADDELAHGVEAHREPSLAGLAHKLGLHRSIEAAAVLPREARGRAKGADVRLPREGLFKRRVDRRGRDGRDALELARRVAIVARDGVVEATEGQQPHERPVRVEGELDHAAEHLEDLPKRAGGRRVGAREGVRSLAHGRGARAGGCGTRPATGRSQTSN